MADYSAIEKMIDQEITMRQQQKTQVAEMKKGDDALEAVLSRKTSLVNAFFKKVTTIKTKNDQELIAAFKEFAEDEKKIQELAVVFTEHDLVAALKEIQSSYDRVVAEVAKVSGKITEQRQSELKKLSEQNQVKIREMKSCSEILKQTDQAFKELNKKLEQAKTTEETKAK